MCLPGTRHALGVTGNWHWAPKGTLPSVHGEPCKGSPLYSSLGLFKSVYVWRPWQSGMEPQELSREFEQSLCSDLSFPRLAAETLGNCGRRALWALHKQWAHPMKLKNVLEDSFSPLCNHGSLLDEDFSHIFMSFVCPCTEASTFSNFRFLRDKRLFFL